MIRINHSYVTLVTILASSLSAVPVLAGSKVAAPTAVASVAAEGKAVAEQSALRLVRNCSRESLQLFTGGRFTGTKFCFEGTGRLDLKTVKTACTHERLGRDCDLAGDIKSFITGSGSRKTCFIYEKENTPTKNSFAPPTVFSGCLTSPTKESNASDVLLKTRDAFSSKHANDATIIEVQSPIVAAPVPE